MSPRKPARRRPRFASRSIGPLNLPGERGPLCPTRRSDWRLLLTAINQGWDVPPDVREQVCAQVDEVLSNRHNVPTRLLLTVAQVVLAMDRANIKLEAAARGIRLDW